MVDTRSPMKGLKYLAVALAITLSFFFIELVGGLVTNSIALMTDAWHMLNDVFALALSIIAAWIAQRPESSKRTYGYYRAEILAAFLQGTFLWILVAFMYYEAFNRLQHPAEVMSLDMLLIAVLGLAANGLSAVILSKTRAKSLNFKGAFLHVVADGLGSIGAIAAGVVMLYTGWFQVDALISLLIGGLVLYSSGKVIKESVNVLLEGVPSHMDLNAIKQRIREVKGVRNVHDLHVWCITPTKMCVMSVHVVVDEGVDKRNLLFVLIHLLKEEFDINHTTIQLEEEGFPKATGEHP